MTPLLKACFKCQDDTASSTSTPCMRVVVRFRVYYYCYDCFVASYGIVDELEVNIKKRKLRYSNTEILKFYCEKCANDHKAKMAGYISVLMGATVPVAKLLFCENCIGSFFD